VAPILEYVDTRGRSPFRRWFDALDPTAASRVATALYRLEQGHESGLKSLGAGLVEYRIDSGPGYRLYLARLDRTRLVLLGAGTKATQRRDIPNCLERWRDVKARQEPGGQACP
jgi:putative addiction module killer protein